MKRAELIMGMPVSIEIVGMSDHSLFEKIFDYFCQIDAKFSTYKTESEISRINRGEIDPQKASYEMREVLKLSEQTKQETSGYFDIQTPQGTLDPSGLVKGWAIWNASKILDTAGVNNYFVEAGGDIQVRGRNQEGQIWKVGVRNPFNPKEIIKVVKLSDQGIATSGTYERGNHIYNPKGEPLSDEIRSLTVIGPNVYEADRFATAAFAMGRSGLQFIQQHPKLAGYMIDRKKQATFTSNFEQYV